MWNRNSLKLIKEIIVSAFVIVFVSAKVSWARNSVHAVDPVVLDINRSSNYVIKFTRNSASSFFGFGKEKAYFMDLDGNKSSLPPAPMLSGISPDFQKQRYAPVVNDYLDTHKPSSLIAIGAGKEQPIFLAAKEFMPGVTPIMEVSAGRSPSAIHLLKDYAMDLQQILKGGAHYEAPELLTSASKIQIETVYPVSERSKPVMTLRRTGAAVILFYHGNQLTPRLLGYEYSHVGDFQHYYSPHEQVGALVSYHTGATHKLLANPIKHRVAIIGGVRHYYSTEEAKSVIKNSTGFDGLDGPGVQEKYFDVVIDEPTNPQ